ncbi:hypothetical protein [Haloarchaeobius sp. DYHT-AS-18]|uniref:hypothetical protein n=1 Tax=Haloarchaeobius sp. DYHT-AS-18 TaxID=3446117 RepID=UPI003EB94192
MRPPHAAIAVVALLLLVPRTGVVFVTPTTFWGLLVGSALLGVPLFALGRTVAERRGFEPQF